MNGTDQSAAPPAPVLLERPAATVGATALSCSGPVDRTSPTPPRRQRPWILVVVEGTPADHPALVWALREAARREATVVAVRVHGESADGPLLDGLTLPAGEDVDLRATLDDAVLRAVVETGITGRTRTAVLDPQVFAALSSAARGADLVVVGGRGKTLLRRPTAPRGRTTPRRA